MNEKQEKFMAKMPLLYQANYKTAISGKRRAAAIKAKCLDCCNWQRVEITACPVDDCPLYSYRPYRRAESVRNPAESGTLAEKTAEGSLDG